MPVSADTLRALMAAGITSDDLIDIVERIDADMTAASTVKVRSAGHNVSGRDLDVPASEWRRLRRAVRDRDGDTCCYCGENTAEDWCCDHVHPLKKGGRSTLDNLAVSCRECNRSKKDRLLSEWKGREQWQ